MAYGDDVAISRYIKEIDEANIVKENKEIMIITNGNRIVRPLSEFSCIARNMGEVKQIRIYVKPEDRQKAEETIR